MTIKYRFSALVAVIFSGTILQAQPAFSQIVIGPRPAIEPVEFDLLNNTNFDNSTIGYDFAVLGGSSYTLSSIGILLPFNLLADPVPVGVWDFSGNSIASTTILPADIPTASASSSSVSEVLPPVSGPAGTYYWYNLDEPATLEPGSYTI